MKEKFVYFGFRFNGEQLNHHIQSLDEQENIYWAVKRKDKYSYYIGQFIEIERKELNKFIVNPIDDKLYNDDKISKARLESNIQELKYKAYLSSQKLLSDMRDKEKIFNMSLKELKETYVGSEMQLVSYIERYIFNK